MPFGFRLNVPGARFTTSAKSDVGAMKFLMNAVLISVLAAVASSVLPAGAVSTASDTESWMVTDCDTESTKRVMDMSCEPPGATCKLVGVFGAKQFEVVS